MKPHLSIIFLLLVLSCNSTNGQISRIHSLPKEWAKLTETDKGLTIYNSCDAGNLLMTFSNAKEGQILLLHGTQEDYTFQVIESNVLKNGSIEFKARWIDTEEVQVFKFLWVDESKGLGRWKTTYSNGYTSDFYFVSTQDIENFPTYNQPCVECWGDECDELEE